MKLKKGFTLAEVLIVLIVIGAIATLTIPSLMRGVTESQWKTAYKKAYNAIVNIASLERVQGGLPGSNGAANVNAFFGTLNSNLSVRDYAKTTAVSTGTAETKFYTGVQISTEATADGANVLNYSGTEETSPWINTEDGLSYMVVNGQATSGCTKTEINDAATSTAALAASCIAVVVDVNGVANNPNTLEPQDETASLTAGTNMTPLSGDRYYIYIGSDGATSGNRNNLVTGRITADVK